MRLLLVDDDPDIRMIATVALSHGGQWEVTAAESGADALRKAGSIKPDVIVLDLMMPELDGLGTLAAMRQRADLAAVPVIFMTAKVQERDLERYREAGAAGCIQKPFDPRSLADEVKRIFALASLQR